MGAQAGRNKKNEMTEVEAGTALPGVAGGRMEGAGRDALDRAVDVDLRANFDAVRHHLLPAKVASASGQ